MAHCLSESPSGRTYAYSPFLHLALLALGCQRSADPRAHDPVVVSRLTAQAQTALENEAEQPALATVQGLLILGHHHTSAGRSSLADIFCRFAVQTCQKLDLGPGGGPAAPLDGPQEALRHARLRTYWA